MRRSPGAMALPRRTVALGGVAALAAVGALGGFSLLAAAVLDDRERAFAVGLPAVSIAAELRPGERACRTEIDVPASFSRVRLPTATFRRPGPTLTVVADTSRGTVPGGYPDNSTVEARLDPVAQGARIVVCVVNDGDHRMALLGAPPDAPPYELANSALTPELGLEFLRDEPRSMAALVPDAFERASRFRAAWVGTWTFWILLGLVAAGLPALLAMAYRSALPQRSSAIRGASRSKYQ